MGVLLAKKMKYFMVTMEVRNFAKAAEALCITRSPLSKAIFELEDYLGGKLFNRTYNSLEPTELAIEYYQKCKPIYEMLVALENECRSGNTESPLMLLFDLSVPELLYQQIVMAMKSENILFNCERYVVNLSDLEGISRKNSIIISLREIASNADCDIDKWQGDEIVICMPNDHNIRQTKTDIFIWKDLTTDYIQRSFSQLTKPFIPDINFIEHNLNLTGLLYNVRAGKGCSLLTRKMATMFKVDGITYLPIKDRRPTIHLYHGNQKSVNKFIPQLKNVINTFI
ncbi:putative LysR family transcriptional regulator [Pseudescherichia vulneris NBRC 102420]|uniref:Putative LysR family transcriptional regulator n=1 Tax=Pseudescherichia vulneris NBRC 102420 TaxID=1115515 RepID=A0A090V5F3_PSEVU|nr:LysR family transcriptional regulator [Pseudescherichia vulneris]GAL60006.1 putative LysR family transcriptional regulator [Pseudescherichia vulneris NBRC 102420]STQ59538.1 LysR family transcriptional regulator [Pseudescherichia vulneris]